MFLAGGRTAGTPAQRDTAYQVAARGQAFVTRDAAGLIAFTSVTRGPDPVVVRSMVPAAELRADVGSAMLRLGLVAIALLVLSIALADRVGRRLVRSAEALGDAAHRLSRGDLEARVDPRGPVELRIAGQELNGLADRISRLLADQRSEAAALAHRLRTPLTALRVETDSLADPGERERLATAADQLTAAVDEVVHTTLQAVREGPHPATELVEAVSSRLDFWAALAEDTGRQLIRDVPDAEIWIPLVPEDVAALIDVLLDNVFTHTPAGTGFRVRVVADPATLAVEDTGTGTSAADRDSTGLGLALATRLTAPHRRHLHLPAGPHRLDGHRDLQPYQPRRGLTALSR